jgi:hypothetical protein
VVRQAPPSGVAFDLLAMAFCVDPLSNCCSCCGCTPELLEDDPCCGCPWELSNGVKFMGLCVGVFGGVEMLFSITAAHPSIEIGISGMINVLAGQMCVKAVEAGDRKVLTRFTAYTFLFNIYCVVNYCRGLHGDWMLCRRDLTLEIDHAAKEIARDYHNDVQGVMMEDTLFGVAKPESQSLCDFLILYITWIILLAELLWVFCVWVVWSLTVQLNNPYNRVRHGEGEGGIEVEMGALNVRSPLPTVVEKEPVAAEVAAAPAASPPAAEEVEL